MQLKNGSSFYLNDSVVQKKSSKIGRTYVELDQSRLDLHEISGTNFNYILSFKHLCSLDLSHNYLKTIPPELVQLEMIEKLNISNNSIKDVNNVVWSQLKVIATIDLSCNNIDTFPSTMLSCSWLKCLNLNNNSLNKIPSEIKGLKSITELYLRSNGIEQLSEDFYQLSKLKILDMSYNQLKQISTKISLCNQLVKLDLSYNLISELPKEMVFLYQLEELNVDYNPIMNPPLKICALGMKHIFKYMGNLYANPSPATRKASLLAADSSSSFQANRVRNIGLSKSSSRSSVNSAKVHKYCVTQSVNDFDDTLFQKFQEWQREYKNVQHDTTRLLYESCMKLCQDATKAINTITGEHYNPENIINILLNGSTVNNFVSRVVSSKENAPIVDFIADTQCPVYLPLITKRWSNFLAVALKLLGKNCPYANEDVIAMAKNPLNHINIILEVINLVYSTK